ncbi:hypothetical protein ACN4EK_24250 [Pantanalinema rosaneae CENA516]|uniref:hypothetical protein n=1 Tax=Pantanalinema rosaneae TaxID=1620701 RepID=UPI003D6FDE84
MLLLKWTLRALWAFTAKQLHAAIVDRPTVKALPAAKPFPGMVKPAATPIPVYPVATPIKSLPTLTMLDLEAIRVGEMTAQAMVTPAIAATPTPTIAPPSSETVISSAIASTSASPIAPLASNPVEPAIAVPSTPTMETEELPAETEEPTEPLPELTEPSPFDFPLEDEPLPPLDRATLVEALLDEAWSRGIRTYPQLIQYVELQTGTGCSRRTISRWKTARQLNAEAA